jgi:hypothetical protein
MEPNSEGMRDRLLSRLPRPENLADYRKEVTSLLEKNEKRLRIEKWGAGATWLFVVALGTVFLWLGGRNAGKPAAAWFGSLACFWLIFGAVELLKHFINRTRVELLKETKQVQLQVLELHDMLRTQGVSATGDVRPTG